MSRFASGARRLHVFDCKRRSLRIDVPRNVAVEHEFNTVITKDGTKDRWPEARLAQLDGAVVACLNKLEHGEPLTREERWYISFFVGFAETRGKGFRDSVRALSSGGVVSETGFVDQRFAGAFSAMTGVWLEPPTIERLMREDVVCIVSGIEEIGGMAEAGFEVARHVFWMDWLVGVAPPGCLFVTSDRPLGLLRPRRGFGHGPLEPGTIRVFPISPATALFIGDLSNTPSVVRETVAIDLVRLANVAVARRCDRYIMGSTEAIVRAAAVDAKLKAL
jgi:Protein of unknown function (DUF4238)